MILNDTNRAKINAAIDYITQQYGITGLAANINFERKDFWHVGVSAVDTTNKSKYNGYAWNVKTPWVPEFAKYLLNQHIDTVIKTEVTEYAPYKQYVLIINEEKQELIYLHKLELVRNNHILGQKYYRDLLKDYCPEFRGYYKKIPLKLFNDEDFFIRFCQNKWTQANNVYTDLCKQIETQTFDDYKTYIELKKKREIKDRLNEMDKDFR
jgi:hypothetical protein